MTVFRNFAKGLIYGCQDRKYTRCRKERGSYWKAAGTATKYDNINGDITKQGLDTGIYGCYDWNE